MAVRKKKNTIRDVAKLAGVSYQTVSRVMNESESVAEETRKRVLQVMKELDFVPSKVARMLTTHRSHTLELIVVNIRHGGRFAESIQTMAMAARDASYDLLVTMTEIENLGAALENAAARLVDGVIMHAPSLDISDEHLLELCGSMPLVRRDYVPTSKLAWVGFDQVYATRIAVEYLIQLGHRQIAAIPPSLDLINGHLRHTIWHKTLLRHGLQPGPMCASEYTFSSGHAAMQQLLATGQPFTAVMVGSDTMALGAMRALRERGLRIPADVSVISFDNAELAAFTEPPLTTIDFNFGQQDATAVKYLIEILSNPDMKLHQRILLPDLIVRASTCELPAARVAEQSQAPKNSAD
ncbi:LacI family DNA-binding transcriptional regulator [Dictyobacter formicarum]|nr:LacI family DNA-binding transcriptional regulator [Dictyobacter formicarum]